MSASEANSASAGCVLRLQLLAAGNAGLAEAGSDLDGLGAPAMRQSLGSSSAITPENASTLALLHHFATKAQSNLACSSQCIAQGHGSTCYWWVPIYEGTVTLCGGKP